jgi:hypothetical protein
MALNIHVLPQAGVFFGFHVVTGHRSKSVAIPAGSSPLLAGPEVQISR